MDPDDSMGVYLNALDGIFVPSSAIGNELHYYEHLASPARVVPFIVDLPARLYSPPDRPARTFGIIARLSPEKNQDVLIRLLPELMRKVPDARLVLVGAGPTEGMLRALAAELGVSDAIEFIPRFDRIDEVIDRIDIVTLLSDVEGMPLTLLEALCYGKPILATAVGSIPDMVIDRYNGYLVDKADMTGIVEHLVEIMADKECYLAMSENSRRLYADRFEPDVVFEQLLELFEEVILQKRGRILEDRLSRGI
ncbi:glycosyltransferase family 4 protein [Methanoculleus taiwanensis]|nr:glycosyltransferase family 4 protein [Methanoculleus taiwanensis]